MAASASELGGLQADRLRGLDLELRLDREHEGLGLGNEGEGEDRRRHLSHHGGPGPVEGRTLHTPNPGLPEIPLAKRDFGLEGSLPRSPVRWPPIGWGPPIAGDDVIVGDAFTDIAVPEHLVTQEFLQLVAARLNPGGIYAMNFFIIVHTTSNTWFTIMR